MVLWFVAGTLLMGIAAFVFLRSSAVAVDVPNATPAQSAQCRNVLIALPDSLDGKARRQVEPDSTQTAAWGEPAVVLRCAVQRPAALLLTSELFDANGVAWFAERTPDGWRFTTTGRGLYVEVAVPGAQSSAAGVLAELAPVVSRTLPKTGNGP